MTDKTSNRPPAKEVKQPREMRVTAAAATGLGYGSPFPGGRKTEGGGSPYHPHRDHLPAREGKKDNEPCVTNMPEDCKKFEMPSQLGDNVLRPQEIKGNRKPK